jgi:hypothetical protein
MHASYHEVLMLSKGKGQSIYEYLNGMLHGLALEKRYSEGTNLSLI